MCHLEAQISCATTEPMTSLPASSQFDTSSIESNPQCIAKKQQLRRDSYPQRRAMNSSARMHAGEQCASLLADSHVLDQATTIACYVSMGTEITTAPLLNLALAHHIRVLVPRLGSGNEIGWSAIEERAQLDNLIHIEQSAGSGSHQHHVLRPDEPQTPVLPPQALMTCDTVLLPALRVNRQGVRLGRGGGWYDRALVYSPIQAPKIAVCWDWEFVDEPIPHEPHDIAVNAVLTPQQFTWVRPTQV